MWEVLRKRGLRMENELFNFQNTPNKSIGSRRRTFQEYGGYLMALAPTATSFKELKMDVAY